MKIDDLEKRLIEENCPRVYSLKGGLPNEEYCIGFNNGSWEVYYSERGIKSGLKIFDNEEDACEYFYNNIFAYRPPQKPDI